MTMKFDDWVYDKVFAPLSYPTQRRMLHWYVPIMVVTVAGGLCWWLVGIGPAISLAIGAVATTLWQNRKRK